MSQTWGTTAFEHTMIMAGNVFKLNASIAKSNIPTVKWICVNSGAARTDIVVYELWLPALAVRYLPGLRLREPFVYCWPFDAIHSFLHITGSYH